MGVLEGRVAVITGAGRGLGREHALLFAREGAHVVVNDLGGAADGSGSDAAPAQSVTDEIIAAGGSASADISDVTDFAAAERLIAAAVDRFGRLDILVNNAGFLRDAYLTSMSEADWDDVLAVHLKGHFTTLRHAAVHWKARSAAGEEVQAAVINTASASGTMLPNPGQANYGTAKAGIAALTLISAAELGRYGVRVNAILPLARTRMSEAVPFVGELVRRPSEPGSFDSFHPGQVSPLVAQLATAACDVSGRVFAVQGGWLAELTGWQPIREATTDGPWSIELVAAALADAPADTPAPDAAHPQASAAADGSAGGGPIAEQGERRADDRLEEAR